MKALHRLVHEAKALASVTLYFAACFIVILDALPLSKRLQGLPELTELVLRSSLYTAAVLAVMMLEKSVESRTEHGGSGVQHLPYCRQEHGLEEDGAAVPAK